MDVALGDEPHAVVIAPRGTGCYQVAGVHIAHEVRRHLLQVAGEHRMDEVGGARWQDAVWLERQVPVDGDGWEDLPPSPVALVAGDVAEQTGSVEITEDVHVLARIHGRHVTQRSPIVLLRDGGELFA